MEEITKNHGAPREKFILYLAVWKRFLTRDRLAKWSPTHDLSYPFATNNDESLDHLFFKCHYLATIWDESLMVRHSKIICGMEG